MFCCRHDDRHLVFLFLPRGREQRKASDRQLFPPIPALIGNLHHHSWDPRNPPRAPQLCAHTSPQHSSQPGERSLCQIPVCTSRRKLVLLFKVSPGVLNCSLLGESHPQEEKRFSSPRLLPTQLPFHSQPVPRYPGLLRGALLGKKGETEASKGKTLARSPRLHNKQSSESKPKMQALNQKKKKKKDSVSGAVLVMK